jgi:hypothetical protein
VTPELLGTIGVYLSAAMATVGFVGFALLARFWSSRGGWHVFWYMLVLAWVLDMGTVAHLFDPPWFTWLRVGTFTVGMPAVLAWRSWIIFDHQHRHRRRSRAAYGEADSRPAAREETQ